MREMIEEMNRLKAENERLKRAVERLIDLAAKAGCHPDMICAENDNETCEECWAAFAKKEER